MFIKTGKEKEQDIPGKKWKQGTFKEPRNTNT